MFVEINDCVTVNTDHIVWIKKVSENKLNIKLTDGTEHTVTDTKTWHCAMTLLQHHFEKG